MADIDINLDQTNIGIFNTSPTAQVYAIGDIHGDIEVLLTCLIDVANVMEIQNGKPVWIGKNNWVIFCGDYVDRSRNTSITRGEGEILYEEEKILYIIRYLDNLARRDNGRIITVIGNHEVMNLEGNFNYVSDFCLSQNFTLFSSPIADKTQAKNNRLKRFTKGGIINYLLRNDDSIYAIARINNWIFCHGGITLNTMNNVCEKFINNNHESECANKDDLFRVTNNWATKCFNNTSDLTIKFRNIFDNEESNVLWNRHWGYSDCNENHCKQLNRLLDYIKSDNMDLRLVVAHCPQPSFNTDKGINSCCSDKLWRIDVAMSRGFDMPYTSSREKKRYWDAINLVYNFPEELWGPLEENIDRIIDYNDNRRPQVLQIEQTKTTILTAEKHLPRNDIKNTIHKSLNRPRHWKKKENKTTDKRTIYKLKDIYHLFSLDDDSIYEPRANNIRFPPDNIFKNNDLKGLKQFMNEQLTCQNVNKLHKKVRVITTHKNSTVGGRKKRKVSKIRKHKNIPKIKKVRKHKGIIQIGGNAGRLRKGYRYSGKKLKSGLPQIIKCKSKY